MGSKSRSDHPHSGDGASPRFLLVDCTKKRALIIAWGPFTTVDNLLFEPLTELLAYATRKPPQVLILEECLQRLQNRIDVAYDSSTPEHQEALRALWSASFPEEELRDLISEQWKDMG